MVQFWLGNKNTVLKAEGNQSGQCPQKKKKKEQSEKHYREGAERESRARKKQNTSKSIAHLGK